jgi:hypothetical protein
VQGRAALSDPVRDYPTSILANWERVERWHDTPVGSKRRRKGVRSSYAPHADAG